MNSNRTCTILLNWNNYHNTLECIHSLINSKPAPDIIVVCDNGSTDNSLWIIENLMVQKYGYRFTNQNVNLSEAFTLNPGIVLINNNTNLGFAAGNNTGINYALQHGYDFIWLLNSDTVVCADALNHLLSAACKSTRKGIWGSTVAYYKAPKIVQCAGGCTYNPLTTVFRFFHNGITLSQAKNLQDQPMDYVYGASFFVRKDVFLKTGLLNEKYFLFYEEIDFCRRAVKNGFELGWCRPSIILHKHGTSLQRMKTIDKSKAQFIAYHENLSTLLFTSEHFLFVLPLVLIIRFIGKTCALLKRRELYLFPPLLSAYKDFLLYKK